MGRVVIFSLLGAALTLPAAAHAIIVDSTPAPLSHVAAGHLALSLRYNSRIDATRSKLVLRQGENARRLTTEVAATPDLLRASTEIAPGAYEVVWQVLATDGHVTRGRIPFTVDGASAAPNIK